MRRFLFLALGLGMLFPTAAYAEEVWLLIKAKGYGDKSYTWQIPTESMADCTQRMSKVLVKANWTGAGPDRLSGICL